METSQKIRMSPFLFIKEHHNLIRSLVKRELAGKFAGTYGGLIWAILQPLLQALVYTFVFSVIMRATTQGEYQHIPFPVWLITGLLPWTMFAESLSSSVNVITRNTNMVKKTLFDKRALPFSCVLSGLAGHGISIIILLVLMLFFRIPPHWTLLLLPFVTILLTLFTLSWAYILAALNVFIRDTDHALSVVLQLLFFATPIVYPAELVPESLQFLVLINPMHHLIAFYRQVILLGVTPDLFTVIVITLGIGIFFMFADSLFRSLSPEFCDVL
ncbi:ABC transporter permease [Maridesulfovibrio frigidus]|uniref:ABC transporter permease n=1 Tax=Maridesulfovibrio frigidus TaxID=340956 RepID=UPI000A0061E8|nr:ABC transporter permease [Maridesulfovibrio frigidus]